MGPRGRFRPGPYDPADLMVLEMSVADRNVSWNFYQDYIGKLQWKHLGFGVFHVILFR